MLLEVGRVVRPHGLRGEVVVELVSNRPELRLAAGTRLRTERGELEVVRATPQRDRWIVVFAGVADRDAAEALRDMVLSAEPLDEEGALWAHELIGSDVVEADGRARGRIVALEAQPAGDLLVLDDGALVPLRFVISHERGRVVVDAPPGLFDVAR